MATEKEKQLAIKILKERIEHATGQKVILKEGNVGKATNLKELLEITGSIIKADFNLESVLKGTDKILIEISGTDIGNIRGFKALIK
jgi:hypothetical protein